MNCRIFAVDKGEESRGCCAVTAWRPRERGRNGSGWWRVKNLPFPLTYPLAVLRMAMDWGRKRKSHPQDAEQEKERDYLMGAPFCGLLLFEDDDGLGYISQRPAELIRDHSATPRDPRDARNQWTKCLYLSWGVWRDDFVTVGTFVDNRTIRR